MVNCRNAPGEETSLVPLGGAEAVGGQGGQAPSSNLPAPLYGEGSVTPKTLRLRSQHLGVEGVVDGTDFAFVPQGEGGGALQLLVLTRHKELHLLTVAEGAASLEKTWVFQEEMYAEDACSPTNILFDAEYADNHFIYVTYCPTVSTTQLVRYNWTPQDGLESPAVILEVGRPDAEAGWHRFGSMGWEADGTTLWLLLGEHESSELAQDVSSPLGSLLRIAPSRHQDEQGYQIPSGNLREQAGAPHVTDPSIFAFGLRSPWRGMRDPWGRIWLGDVGADSAEELNLVTTVGQNFGWPFHEGPCVTDCETITDPIAFYDHSNDHTYIKEEAGALSGEMRSIWVGELLHNPEIDRYGGLLSDVVVFGDLFTGAVRGLALDERGNVIENRPIMRMEFVVAWKVGPDGYVYALDLGGGFHVVLPDVND